MRGIRQQAYICPQLFLGTCSGEFKFVSSCLLQATQECFMSTAFAQMGGSSGPSKLCPLCVPFPWEEMSEDQEICRVQMD